jgi:hypothetical protein
LSYVALGSLFLHQHLLAEALGCVTNEFTALLMQRRVTTANKRICANEFRFEIISYGQKIETAQRRQHSNIFGFGPVLHNKLAVDA